MAAGRSALRLEIGYVAAMTAIALGVAIVTGHYAPVPPWPQLLGFTLAAGLLASRTIQLSSTVGSVSVAYIFVFAALLELGPIGALAAAAAAALGGTVFAPNRPIRRPLVVVSAVSNLALAATAAAWAYLRLHEACAEIGMNGGLLPAFVVIGVYYLVNSAGVCLLASVRSDRSAWRLWSDSISWTVLPFYFGGAAAMGMHLLALGVGPLVWAGLIPVVLLVHTGLELRARAVAAAKLAEERSSTP